MLIIHLRKPNATIRTAAELIYDVIDQRFIVTRWYN
jgi:hypothetical protein